MSTINETLDDFLVEIGEGNPNSSSSPKSIVDALRSCLNAYAHDDLTVFERTRFDKEWSEDRQYCDMFGPGNLDPSHINYFLSFFVIRHVAGTGVFLNACGPLMERLATWLADKGHWTPDRIAAFQELVGGKAGSDLAACEAFGRALLAHAARHPMIDADDIPDQDYLEENFTITKVAPGKLYLNTFDEEEILLALPKRLTNKAKAGWSVLLEMGRIQGKWKVLGVGNVYP